MREDLNKLENEEKWDLENKHNIKVKELKDLYKITELERDLDRLNSQFRDFRLMLIKRLVSESPEPSLM